MYTPKFIEYLGILDYPDTLDPTPRSELKKMEPLFEEFIGMVKDWPVPLLTYGPERVTEDRQLCYRLEILKRRD